MKTINRSTIKGRVGREVTFHQLPSGSLAVRFSVATDHVFQKRGGPEKHTEWHQVKTYIPKDQESLFRANLTPGSWVFLEAAVITDVVEQNGKKEFYRFLRPSPEDIDFLPRPRKAEQDPAMPDDEDAYLPAPTRAHVDSAMDDEPAPAVPTGNGTSTPATAPPPVPPHAPTPSPRAYEPRERGRLWDRDDDGRRPSRPVPRRTGSVKDLLQQE